MPVHGMLILFYMIYIYVILNKMSCIGSLRDTVSSVGFARKPSLPETTSGMAHVCAFRHALALDELRVKFLPEYADGGAGPSGGGNVKEVWFAGSHSDMYVLHFPLHTG